MAELNLRWDLLFNLHVLFHSFIGSMKFKPEVTSRSQLWLFSVCPVGCLWADFGLLLGPFGRPSMFAVPDECLQLGAPTTVDSEADLKDACIMQYFSAVQFVINVSPPVTPMYLPVSYACTCETSCLWHRSMMHASITSRQV